MNDENIFHIFCFRYFWTKYQNWAKIKWCSLITSFVILMKDLCSSDTKYFSVTLMKLWINYYDISHQKNGKEKLHDRNRLKGRRYEHMKKWSVMFWQTGCIKRTNKSIPLVNTSSPPSRMKTTEPKEIACNFYLR